LLMSSVDAPCWTIQLHCALTRSTTNASSTALIASRLVLMAVLLHLHRAWLEVSNRLDQRLAQCCSHQGCSAKSNRDAEPCCLSGIANRLSICRQTASLARATPRVQTATRVDPIAFAPAAARASPHRG